MYTWILCVNNLLKKLNNLIFINPPIINKEYIMNIISNKDNVLLSYFIFIFFLIILLSMVPLVTAILIPCLLIITSEYISDILRKFLSVIGFLSIAIIQSSWVVTLVADIGIYYNNYISLLNSNYESIFEFGGGIEIIIPLYFLILGNIFGEISPSQLVLAVDIPVVIVISFFLNSVIKKINHKNRAFIVGACLVVFFATSWASLLLRQYFSLMFFLLALKYRSKTFGILSIFTHFSALFFFILLKTYTINKTIFRTFIIVFSLATYFITDISYFIINTVANPIIAQKFYFYLDDGNFSATGNLSALYSTFIACIYLFITWIFEKKGLYNLKIRHIYRVDIFLLLMAIIMTMNIPLLPGRFFIIPILFSPLLAYLSSPLNNSIIFKSIYILYFFMLVIRFLTPTLSAAEFDVNSYWQSFNWYGSYPFYYLSE